VIGLAFSPTRSVFANNNDDVDRYIIVYQKRDLNNATLRLPGPLANLTWKTGKFRFVFIGVNADGEVVPEAPISGYVFVFFSSELWKKTPYESPSAESLVKAAQKKLAQYDPETPIYALRAAFDADFNRLIADLEARASCWAEFRLDRSGEFSLKELHEHAMRSALPGIPRDRQRVVSALANEIYYFAKDISHKHQHHLPRDGTMLSLGNYDGTPRWAVNTLRSLRFRIIEGFRLSTETGYSSALGFLAYKRTFADVARNRLQLPALDNFDDDVHTEQSIKARLETIRIESNERVKQRQFLAGMLLSVVGAIFGYLQIVPQPDRIALASTVFGFFHSYLPGTTFLGEYLSGHPRAVVGLILSIASAIFLATYRKIGPPYALIEFVYRVMARIRRKVVLSIAGALLAVAIIAFFAILLR
jgi:hypothetical protein